MAWLKKSRSTMSLLRHRATSWTAVLTATGASPALARAWFTTCTMKSSSAVEKESLAQAARTALGAAREPRLATSRAARTRGVMPRRVPATGRLWVRAPDRRIKQMSGPGERTSVPSDLGAAARFEQHDGGLVGHRRDRHRETGLWDQVAGAHLVQEAIERLG